MTKVSVIIPMYNVAGFIEKCANSLLNQTLEDVEFIFVDDGSPDNSAEIVTSLAAKYPRRDVIVVKHQTNKGLPGARNTGLSLAHGDYIFHCDGDDWMEPDMLEKLFEAAESYHSDYVWCDFFISFEHNERYMQARDYKTPDELLFRGFLSGDMKYNVWNKLVKRTLYSENGILFPEGHSMGEDMTMIKLACCASSVSYVPKALYHYVKTNAGAFTQTMSERSLSDIRYNTDDTIGFLISRKGSSLDKAISLFKLNVKLPFLITDDNRLHELWRNWYPEANKYAMANRELPFRTRLLQWLASINQWWLVKSYYKFVYKFIYGIIYR